MCYRARKALNAIADEKPDTSVRAFYIDIHDEPPFEPRQDESVQEVYVQVNPDCLLPFDELNKRGFMTADLTIVGSPTRLHGLFASQAASVSRTVAVDKPLSPSVSEARAMARFPNVFGLTHFVAKESVRPLWALNPHDTVAVDAVFMETGGVGRRDLDPAYEDLGYHQGAYLLAHFREGRLNLERCATMTYVPDLDDPVPRVSTAARLEGFVELPERRVPFRIVVGKGFDQATQELHVCSIDGKKVISQAGDTPNWLPYRRMLESLLLDDASNWLLPMEMHVELVRFCARAAEIQEDAGCYEFGETPPFCNLELAPCLAHVLPTR
jgi:hypothetical protein